MMVGGRPAVIVIFAQRAYRFMSVHWRVDTLVSCTQSHGLPADCHMIVKASSPFANCGHEEQTYSEIANDTSQCSMCHGMH